MEKKVFRTIDGLFYNSQCLFIEYHDILNIPWLSLLLITKKSKLIKELFDLGEIEHYEVDALIEWYKYRKHRNIFDEFKANKEVNTEAFLNSLMNAPNASYFHTFDIEMPFVNATKVLIDSRYVKRIVIYSENEETGIRDFIDSHLGATSVEYMHGDLTECLKKIPIDSTYVFSDIMKINNLIESEHINYSSFLIANDLRYNYEENDSTKFKIDIEKLLETYIFKPAYFNAFPKL